MSTSVSILANYSNFFKTYHKDGKRLSVRNRRVSNKILAIQQADHLNYARAHHMYIAPLLSKAKQTKEQTGR
jgi:hypothetical protein